MEIELSQWEASSIKESTIHIEEMKEKIQKLIKFMYNNCNNDNIIKYCTMYINDSYGSIDREQKSIESYYDSVKHRKMIELFNKY